MANNGVCAYDYEAAELRADLHDCASGDERAFEEVSRRGNLRLRVDDRREVMPAQTLCYICALRVLADGNEDGRTGIVARRLLNGPEDRESLEVVALLPLRVIVCVADDVPLRLLRKRVDALDGPDCLAAKAARSYNKRSLMGILLAVRKLYHNLL